MITRDARLTQYDILVPLGAGAKGEVDSMAAFCPILNSARIRLSSQSARAVWGGNYMAAIRGRPRIRPPARRFEL